MQVAFSGQQRLRWSPYLLDIVPGLIHSPQMIAPEQEAVSQQGLPDSLPGSEKSVIPCSGPLPACILLFSIKPLYIQLPKIWKSR